ncbi:NUDIX domain-containing protein [Nonomuraea sp. NPDC051191]|uniref:NUDIX domain-containing protein n=1 Tax=Nonomuraea sp. NPDC051191 TaxID=3364372 RepID=UPI0037A6EBF2
MTYPDLPFSHVKIRVAGLVFCGRELALIRRDRPSGALYTPPGGNVHPGEDLVDALSRELAEELRLDPGDATVPQLCWIQDQMITRPGPTPPPRKLHLIFRLHITPEVRAKLATVEYDELPDGTSEPGIIEWVDHRQAARLNLFPLIGVAVSTLADPTAPPANPYLTPMTDATYTWR